MPIGDSQITAIEGGDVVLTDQFYASPRGNLGREAWAFVNARGEITVHAHRTGRRIDVPRVVYYYRPDGSIITSSDIAPKELLEELEENVE